MRLYWFDVLVVWIFQHKRMSLGWGVYALSPMLHHKKLTEVHRMTPQMTLRTKRSKVLYMYVTSVPESQFSVRFDVLWQAVLELQAILKKVHWMAPIWPWTLQGERYSKCITNMNESQISVRCLKLQAILRKVHRMTPNDLDPIGQMYPKCINNHKFQAFSF